MDAIVTTVILLAGGWIVYCIGYSRGWKANWRSISKSYDAGWRFVPPRSTHTVEVRYVRAGKLAPRRLSDEDLEALEEASK